MIGIPEIKVFFQQIHPLNDSLIEAYLGHWKPCVFPKKTVMTSTGVVEKYTYLVLDGIQKSYYEHQGKIHVIAFTYPPSFSGIPDSFLVQKPSKYYLETITDSKFLRLPYNKHQQLMNEYRGIETLFRKATEMVLVGMIERHYELMAMDITSRFKSFVKRSPHLLHKVAQKDLASYLNIDATNFSKLLNTVKI